MGIPSLMKKRLRHIPPSLRRLALLRGNPFADEEAIETLVPEDSEEIWCVVGIASLTKKRLRRDHGQLVFGEVIGGNAFADEEAIETR